MTAVRYEPHFSTTAAVRVYCPSAISYAEIHRFTRYVFKKIISAGRPGGLVVALARYYVVLVREFESRHREILKLFEKTKTKKGQLLRAPSAGRHNSTRVDEERKRAEIFSR